MDIGLQTPGNRIMRGLQLSPGAPQSSLAHRNGWATSPDIDVRPHIRVDKSPAMKAGH